MRIKNIRVHPLLLPACLLFLLHQLLQKVWHIPIPLADHYLDPLLCMPILLSIWQLEHIFLFKRKVTTIQIWLLTLWLSLLFEIGFPLFSSHFFADWKDAALYFTGTGIFLMLR